MRLAQPQTIGTSPITLDSLLKHLALVEDDYFTRRLIGGDMSARWDRSAGMLVATGNGTQPLTIPPRS